MTEVNLYLDCKGKKIKTYQFEEDINNIDCARILLIKYIEPFYLSSKYHINITNRYGDDKNSTISLFIDNNKELNREFTLNKILGND